MRYDMHMIDKSFGEVTKRKMWMGTILKSHSLQILGNLKVMLHETIRNDHF